MKVMNMSFSDMHTLLQLVVTVDIVIFLTLYLLFLFLQIWESVSDILESLTPLKGLLCVNVMEYFWAGGFYFVQ